MKVSMQITDSENKELEETIKKETAKMINREEIPTEADGYKRFNGLIFVPKQIEEEVVRRHHNDEREGHPGIARTMEKLQRNYYFPGMQRKVAKYIKRCDSCARNKNNNQHPQGAMIIDEPAPERPWQKITADFVEMPPTRHAIWGRVMDEILVVVDSFTKYTILIPTTKTATTEEVFYLLWERIFAIFGIPERMISDRDRIFKTEKWRKLMNSITATVELSTAYHQQSDGQSERKIQELRAYMRHYLDYEQTNWLELTPMAQYAINDAKSVTTGETPNFLLFGTMRRMGKDERTTEPGMTHDQRMKTIHAQVKMDIQWQEQLAKQYYDRKRKPHISYQPGDQVYLRRRTTGSTTFNIKTKRPSQKLDSLRIGPFRITQTLPRDNYKLELPDRMRIHPVFHASLLDKTDNPVSERDDILNEYEVERILAKRVKKGVTEYLVKWKDYDETENTWEPTKHLNCPDEVRKFETRQQQEKLMRP